MILQAYAIRDIKAEAFNPPFYVATRGLAIRSFQEALNDSSHPFAKYPADFQLYFLGEYNDATGISTASGVPELVGTASDFVTRIV